ncbi:hypothetical protein [Prevotella sp. HMSC073D09]|nr:hypothetical protein [Prevotella sp. HMSC073D09]
MGIWKRDAETGFCKTFKPQLACRLDEKAWVHGTRQQRIPGKP